MNLREIETIHTHTHTQHNKPMSSQSELCFAAAQGNLKRVIELLDVGQLVDERDGQRQTALHHAARAGHIDVLDELLERGADATLVTVHG